MRCFLSLHIGVEAEAPLSRWTLGQPKFGEGRHRTSCRGPSNKKQAQKCSSQATISRNIGKGPLLCKCSNTQEPGHVGNCDHPDSHNSIRKIKICWTTDHSADPKPGTSAAQLSLLQGAFIFLDSKLGNWGSARSGILRNKSHTDRLVSSPACPSPEHSLSTHTPLPDKGCFWHSQRRVAINICTVVENIWQATYNKVFLAQVAVVAVNTCDWPVRICRIWVWF